MIEGHEPHHILSLLSRHSILKMLIIHSTYTGMIYNCFLPWLPHRDASAYSFSVRVDSLQNRISEYSDGRMSNLKRYFHVFKGGIVKKIDTRYFAGTPGSAREAGERWQNWHASSLFAFSQNKSLQSCQAQSAPLPTSQLTQDSRPLGVKFFSFD